MTQNPDPAAPAICDFPIKKREITMDMCADETIFQAKLSAIRILNQVAAGVYELKEEDKEAIRSINRICRLNGYSSLDCDF